MAGFQFAMTSFSILTRVANGSCLVNVPHMVRITIVSMLAMTSFALIALASFNAPAADEKDPPIFWFVVAVLASCLIGISSGMGEATFLGFLKGYPSHTVGYVSSGTGFAGLSGTGTLLILQGMGLANQYIFLIACPTILVYYLAFVWLNKKKKELPFIKQEVAERASLVEQHEQAPDALMNPSNFGSEANRQAAGNAVIDEEEPNVPLTWTSGLEILPRAFPLIINLFTVYFLEYCIIGCFADRMAIRAQNRHADELDCSELRCFIWKDYYVILNYCYQVGVFCSRSSLSLFQIKRQHIWILTALQLLNWFYFFANTQWFFMPSLYVNCPIMIWVGFMGGAAYVNVMHNLLDLPSLKKTEREVALVLSLMFNDTGVLLSAVFTQIVDVTIYSADKLT